MWSLLLRTWLRKIDRRLSGSWHCDGSRRRLRAWHRQSYAKQLVRTLMKSVRKTARDILEPRTGVGVSGSSTPFKVVPPQF